MNHDKNWYAVLTAPILYNKKLNARQKVLMAVIANLSNEKGYCFATNKYLADLNDCSIRCIQSDIELLEKENLLGRVMKVDNEGELVFRALIPVNHSSSPMKSDSPPHEEPLTPPCAAVHPPMNSGSSIITKRITNIKNKDNIGMPQSPNFVKPSILEISDYCAGRKNAVDAEKFHNHYESNGWMVGRTKMKDWRAAVRTWEKNDLAAPSKQKIINENYHAGKPDYTNMKL